MSGPRSRMAIEEILQCRVVRARVVEIAQMARIGNLRAFGRRKLEQELMGGAFAAVKVERAADQKDGRRD